MKSTNNTGVESLHQSVGGVIRSATIAAVALSSLVLVGSAPAQSEAFSPIVGFSRTTIADNSDTVLTVGFHDTPAFAGKLSSAAASGSASSAELQISGTPGFSVDEFATSHYVHVRSGISNGRIFPISGNSATSITVDLGDGEPLIMSVDDQLSVIPWWTLDSLIPPTSQPASQVGAGELIGQRGVEVHLYEKQEGAQLSANRVFFLTNSGWQESAQGFPAGGDTVIPPNSVLVFRTQESAPGGEPWNLVFAGTVSEQVVAIPLSTRIDGPQDNVLGLNRPVPVNLTDLGLESVFEESADTSEGARADELLVFESVEDEKNRQPTLKYFRTGGQWVRDEPGFPSGETDSIPAGAGLIVRTAPSVDGAARVWINSPNF